MQEPRIFNIQKYSLHDGPGIRTLVFFQGCPLRCLWCANPEGQKAAACLMRSASLCSSCGACATACPTGAISMTGGIPRHDQALCSGCRACEDKCPQAALTLCGKRISIAEIMAIILEDKTFYDVSGGGMTIGGGEPLAQPDAAAALLRECRKAGIHSAVETCGFAPPEAVAQAAPLADLFLFDLKSLDPQTHKKVTGQENGPILANFEYLLRNGFPVRCRMPIIPGLNADEAEMRARARYLAPFARLPNFLGADLLPYHRLGVGKYTSLGLAYTLPHQPAANDPRIEEWRQILEDAGVNARIVRH